jgi:hypothetical protein
MDDELKRRLEDLERKLDATASLVRIGLPIVTGLDNKINSLIDSHVRLYDSIEQLAASERRLAEAQAATETSLRTLIESLRSPNGGKQ